MLLGRVRYRLQLIVTTGIEGNQRGWRNRRLLLFPKERAPATGYAIAVVPLTYAYLKLKTDALIDGARRGIGIDAKESKEPGVYILLNLILWSRLSNWR